MTMEAAEKVENQNEDLELRVAIDRSLKLPLLFFFTSSAAWLLFSSLLGFAGSLALNLPELVEGYALLQYGRLQPALQNSLLYGWAIQAAVGVGYWLIGRLGRVPLRSPLGVLVGGHLWNLVVGLGVISVLLGYGTSMAWFDFPAAFSPILLVAFLVMTVGMVGMSASQLGDDHFVSERFVLGGIFWFLFVYVTASAFVHFADGAAVLKAAIVSWFGSNMLFMVLTPAALAASCYLACKTVGRPLYSSSLAHFSFWGFVLISGWTGFARYMGGPLPAWMPTVSGAAAVFLLVPGLAMVGNLFLTLRGKLEWMNYSPALRFTVFGQVALVVTLLLHTLLSLIPTGGGLQFTQAHAAYEMVGILGFFSMTMFGAIYFIVPRITGCEWLSGGLIRFHFWFSAYGIISIVAFTFFAGLAQRSLHADFTTEFMISVERLRHYFVAFGLGWLLIFVGNLVFFMQMLLMALKRGRTPDAGPTLIHREPSDYFTEKILNEEVAT